MSTTTAVSTDPSGNAIAGTPGTTIGNQSANALNSNAFLELMMAQLTHQDPLSPSSSDPTKYLSELAQMTSVEQQTKTAQSTAQSASAQAVSAAVALIGKTVSYISQSTGQTVSGSVQSVQITGSGPTLTVNGVTGVAPSTITNVS